MAAIIPAMRRRMLSHGFSVDMMRTERLAAAVSAVVPEGADVAGVLLNAEGSAMDLVAAAAAILARAVRTARPLDGPWLDVATCVEIDGARVLLNTILHGSVR